MATKIWTGSADGVFQLEPWTVGGTWLAGEKITLKVGNRSIVITLGATVTTSAVASAIAAGLIAESATATIAGDETRNLGGYQLGEFRFLTATSASAVVTVVGTEAGRPFVLAMTTDSASGTLTQGSVTAATGPNYIDNADNWHDTTAPVDGDDLVFTRSTISCKYTNDATPAKPGSVTRTRSYGGDIGLDPINADITNYEFVEYRERFLEVEPNNGTTYFCHIGEGVGDRVGKSRFNFEDVNAKVIISDKSGLGADGLHPIELKTGNTGYIDVTVRRGHVSLGTDGEFTCNVQALRVSVESKDTDSSVSANCNWHLNGVVVVTGGEVRLLTATGNDGTIDVYGGNLIAEQGDQDKVSVHEGGTYTFNSSGTSEEITVFGGGKVDFSKDLRSKTVDTVIMHSGAECDDTYGAMGAPTNGFDLVNCGPNDVTLKTPDNKTWTPTTI